MNECLYKSTYKYQEEKMKKLLLPSLIILSASSITNVSAASLNTNSTVANSTVANSISDDCDQDGYPCGFKNPVELTLNHESEVLSAAFPKNVYLTYTSKKAQPNKKLWFVLTQPQSTSMKLTAKFGSYPAFQDDQQQLTKNNDCNTTDSWPASKQGMITSTCMVKINGQEGVKKGVYYAILYYQGYKVDGATVQITDIDPNHQIVSPYSLSSIK